MNKGPLPQPTMFPQINIPSSFMQNPPNAFSYPQTRPSHSFLKENLDSFKNFTDSYPSRAGVQREGSYTLNFPQSLRMFDDYQQNSTETPCQAQSPNKFSFKSPKTAGKLNSDPMLSFKKSHFYVESHDMIPNHNGMIYPNEELGNPFHEFMGSGFSMESQQKMMNVQRVFNTGHKFNSESAIPNIQHHYLRLSQGKEKFLWVFFFF